MAEPKPIETAPKDGRKVTVLWTDRDGQENETIAQYRSLDRLKLTGGDSGTKATPAGGPMSTATRRNASSRTAGSRQPPATRRSSRRPVVVGSRALASQVATTIRGGHSF